LMIVGVVGLVLTLIMTADANQAERHDNGVTIVERDRMNLRRGGGGGRPPPPPPPQGTSTTLPMFCRSWRRRWASAASANG
jgi:hypothetical protein